MKALLQKIQISSNLKSFLSDSVLYTIINLINKAIPFILLPIIVRIVNSTEYGIYSIFVTFEAMLLPIVSLNTHSALASHFYDDHINKKTYISTITLFLFFTIIIFTAVSFLFPNSLINKIGLNEKIFYIAFITAGINGLTNLFSTLFRLQRKPMLYGCLIIGNSIILLGIILIFINFFEANSINLISGRLVAFLLFSIISIIILIKLKFITFSFDKKILKRVLKFSLPTIVYSISAFVFAASDKLIIQLFMEEKFVGYYSAIFQVSSLISVLGMSINAAWIPWLYESLKKKDKKLDLFIVKLSYKIMFVFIILSLFFCLLLPFFSKILLTKEYLQYSYIGIPIAIGFTFQILYFIVSPYISFVEKTKYLAYGGIGIAIINLILNVILIPSIGLMGASIANCISWICLFIYSFYWSSKLYPMPWSIKKRII